VKTFSVFWNGSAEWHDWVSIRNLAWLLPYCPLQLYRFVWCASFDIGWWFSAHVSIVLLPFSCYLPRWLQVLAIYLFNAILSYQLLISSEIYPQSTVIWLYDILMESFLHDICRRKLPLQKAQLDRARKN
jgi:hypothetical protein